MKKDDKYHGHGVYINKDMETYQHILKCKMCYATVSLKDNFCYSCGNSLIGRFKGD